MKTNFFTVQFFPKICLLCMLVFFAGITESYSQFVDKKTDSTKIKPVKKDTVKKVTPVTNSVIKVVEADAYDIPVWSYGVHLVPRFGSDPLFEIAPFVARKMGKKTLLGGSIFYAYNETDDGTGTGNRVKRNHYGIRVFGQYYPTKYIYGHAEVGAINKDNTSGNSTTGTDLVVGGGFRLPVSKKFAVHIMLLYDMVRQNNTNIHGNTFVRLGIVF